VLLVEPNWPAVEDDARLYDGMFALDSFDSFPDRLWLTLQVFEPCVNDTGQ
jgi:hypothetical protein